MRNSSIIVRIGMPLIVIVLTLVFIFIQSETGFSQIRPGFAQNISGEQRNRTLNHLLLLRKPESTFNSSNIRKPDSPLSVVESMRNSDNSNLLSRAPLTIGSEKNNVTNIGGKGENNMNAYYTL